MYNARMLVGYCSDRVDGLMVLKKDYDFTDREDVRDWNIMVTKRNSEVWGYYRCLEDIFGSSAELDKAWHECRGKMLALKVEEV